MHWSKQDLISSEEFVSIHRKSLKLYIKQPVNSLLSGLIQRVQHEESNEGQQEASAQCTVSCSSSSSSLQLLTDGGSYIITHFLSISNSLWWINIFTRPFVNSILVFPLPCEVARVAPIVEPRVVKCEGVTEGQAWHYLPDLDSWLEANPKRVN